MTSKQRAYLRGLAHSLKPVLHVGKEGVTDAAVRSAEQAFNTRELVKLKVLDAAPDTPQGTADALAGRLGGAEVVQVIGRTAVLYRRDPDRPKIVLPS